MNESQIIEFAEEMKEFINLKKMINNDNDGWKLVGECPIELIESFKRVKKALDEMWPNLDEKICEYSMSYSMDYLITLRKLMLMIDCTIEANPEKFI